MLCIDRSHVALPGYHQVSGYEFPCYEPSETAEALLIRGEASPETWLHLEICPAPIRLPIYT